MSHPCITTPITPSFCELFVCLCCPLYFVLIAAFVCDYISFLQFLTTVYLLWPPYGIGQAIIFLPCDFYLSSIFFFSSPNLSGRRLDVYHTWCGLSANLECMSEMWCTRLAENTGLKKSPFWHHWQSEKKLVKHRYLLHMSSWYGELWPTNGWDLLASLRHPYKFQQILRLGSVTARHLVVGVSQTLRRWTEGATYVRQGDHQVGHWPTF